MIEQQFIFLHGMPQSEVSLTKESQCSNQQNEFTIFKYFKVKSSAVKNLCCMFIFKCFEEAVS